MVNKLPGQIIGRILGDRSKNKESKYKFGDNVSTPNGRGKVHDIEDGMISVTVYGKKTWYDENDKNIKSEE
jgi:hypothetical protein